MDVSGCTLPGHSGPGNHGRACFQSLRVSSVSLLVTLLTLQPCEGGKCRSADQHRSAVGNICPEPCSAVFILMSVVYLMRCWDFLENWQPAHLQQQLWLLDAAVGNLVLVRAHAWDERWQSGHCHLRRKKGDHMPAVRFTTQRRHMSYGDWRNCRPDVLPALPMDVTRAAAVHAHEHVVPPPLHLHII
jgi:hypothetical protein